MKRRKARKSRCIGIDFAAGLDMKHLISSGKMALGTQDGRIVTMNGLTGNT